MTIASNEQAVVDAVPKQLFIGGEWRDASGGATLAVEDPATGETLCEVADATADDALAALDAACAAQAEWAAHPPRERGEILRRAYEEMIERADELALLMTLEMGKALAESKAEIAYAAEFLRWFAEEAVRIDGRYATAPNGAGRLLTMKQPVGPVPADHPVELPAGDGHAQDRPGGRRRLHDGRQAGEADAAVDARARPDPREGRAAGGRAERRHRAVGQRRDRPADRRPAPAQAVVHRLDRGRPQADRAVGAERAAAVDGARRQRAVPRLRGRRPRRRGRGRDDRQDAQHRRGLHRGEPLPRRTRRSPRSSPTSSPSGWAS